MLFTYRALDEQEQRVEAATARMPAELRHHFGTEPRRWTGLLARMTRARALAASNSVEGINVSDEDAIAAIDGEDPANTDRETWRAVVGYRQAMDYILQRRRSPSFTITEDVLLAVHFMICQSHLGSRPGQYRIGWVGVRSTETGEIVHEGVDRDQLEPLIQELLDYANDGEVTSVFLRAAMTHLNLVMLHPFVDGNGRTARCIQTAVLANDGIVAPPFSSIEEYIGHNQQAYSHVLAEVGGGAWHPERDAKPWVRFCLTGHYRQAQTLLRRTRELESIYAELSALIERNGFPDRMTMALLQAAVGGRVRNSSYRVSADVSKVLASRDLKRLVDADLLIPKGEKRGRMYFPSRTVARIRTRLRLPGRVTTPLRRTVLSRLFLLARGCLPFDLRSRSLGIFSALAWQLGPRSLAHCFKHHSVCDPVRVRAKLLGLPVPWRTRNPRALARISHTAPESGCGRQDWPRGALVNVDGRVTEAGGGCWSDTIAAG